MHKKRGIYIYIYKESIQWFLIFICPIGNPKIPRKQSIEMSNFHLKKSHLDTFPLIMLPTLPVQVPPSIVSQGSLNVAALKSAPDVPGLSSYVNLRQVSHRYHLSPGTYCVVPSTFQPGEEAHFILRLFCEKPYSVK